MRGEINVFLLGSDLSTQGLFTEAASKYGIGLRLHIIDDINALLQMMNKVPDKLAPNTILLLVCDFRLFDGLVYLRAIKEHKVLRHFPLLIVGRNYDAQKCQDCFSAGAAGLFPFDPSSNNLAELLRVIGDYWRMSELPD